MPLIEWSGVPSSAMRNPDSPGHDSLVPKANSGILPHAVRSGTTGERRDVRGVLVVVTRTDWNCCWRRRGKTGTGDRPQADPSATLLGKPHPPAFDPAALDYVRNSVDKLATIARR